MNSAVRSDLAARIARIHSLPTIPAVIRPLMSLLAVPRESADVTKIAETISYDKSISAQLLRMSNSALYSPSRPVESVRAAVVSLGLMRVQEIVYACTFCQSVRFEKRSFDPVVFWRHSLGCALVSRELSRRIDFPDPEQAYLAALLHDIGFQINSMIDPERWRKTVERACSMQIPLLDAELAILGYTHCQTGRILAEQWQLPAALGEAIEFHHAPGDSSESRDLTAIVHLSDLLCRLRGMGYGYYEALCVDFMNIPAWALLAGHFSKLVSMDLSLFTFELDSLIEDVQKTVDEIFSMQAATH
ncbi:MAG: HDOD domain-containing protein [Candidatus Acidiferrales bacterium]